MSRARPRDLVADPRFSGPVERYKNSRALVEVFDAIFRTRSLAEWEQALEKAGIIWSRGAPHARSGVADPQAREMGYLPVVEHPRVGPFPDAWARRS